MAAELTAVRLLAPHFGDSAYVWTNVIGVILAAMALGASLGGRLCARASARWWPARLLALGAVLLAAAPFVTAWLGPALLGDGLPLDAAMPALIRGSFVVSALVFAPPMLMLAAVSPLLVVLSTRAGVKIGRAAGDVAAAGTVGSLLGTFLATHVLVPSVGCRLTMVVAAAVLLLGALIIAPRRGRRAGVAALALVGCSSMAHGGPLRPAPAGTELLAERETPYQLLQVQRVALDGAARTTLVINEGLDSYHSVAIADSAFTAGAYYDWHAVAPLLAREGASIDGLRAASIGDAAGSLRRIYAALYPGVEVDAVDIDAATMALGDEFFPGDKAGGRRFAMDGRQFVRHAREQWDVIHVDAYAHQVYVPAHLASVEFFRDAYARLATGGVLACNVGALTYEDPVLRAMYGTVREVFDDAAVLLIPSSRNALLVGRRGASLSPAAMTYRGASGLSDADEARWSTVLEHARDHSRWRRLQDAGPVLFDDKPALDELLLDSYLAVNEEAHAVEAIGSRLLADAEQLAYEANRRGDWAGAVRALEESREESAFLRLQAGDARWSARQLGSAAQEYAAGLRLEAGGELQRKLRARAEALEVERAPLLRASAAATRTWWLGLLTVVCGAGVWRMLRRL
ncbi:MAG: fused MFS/spermidine synthase [Planctomycetota bacterium]|nr:fused MFS/spermidine synthase [Planctomycetota bacterium]